MALTLILKRASASRQSGEWNEDDFDVLANGEVVGPMYKPMRARLALDVDALFRASRSSQPDARLCRNPRGRHGSLCQELATRVNDLRNHSSITFGNKTPPARRVVSGSEAALPQQLASLAAKPPAVAAIGQAARQPRATCHQSDSWRTRYAEGTPFVSNANELIHHSL
jgi:hypothetical protein